MNINTEFRFKDYVHVGIIYVFITEQMSSILEETDQSENYFCCPT